VVVLISLVAYVAAMVASNLLVSRFGPGVTPINSFFHPPRRDCLCADCTPSFDIDAGSTAQRHDMTLGVKSSNAEWMVDAKSLVFRLMRPANVEGADHAPHVSVDAAKAALFEHLSKIRDSNG